MRPTFFPRRLCLSAVVLCPLDALASGWSADIELIRPSLSPSGAFAIERAAIEGQGTTHVGLALQLEADPLVYYENGLEVGPIVRWRTQSHLGVSRDLTDALSARIVLPVTAQWGTEIPSFAASGLGLGDASIGMRGEVLDGRGVELGLRGELFVPTGRREAWMGEANPRLWVGALVSGESGPVVGLVDLGLIARSPVQTPRDFTLGPELTASAAVRTEVRWGIDAQLGLAGRAGLSDALSGGAENALEGLLGVGWAADHGVRFDAGVGRGLSMGYGTTDWRLTSAVTVTRSPRPREVRPIEDVLVAADADLPDQMPLMPDWFIEEEPEPPPPPVAVWAPDEVARIEATRIVLRDPVRFELATARILPESISALEHVAGLLAADPTVLHLLIEGHASVEGSFGYNYELSNDRARAIFEALVRAGVHPDRLSYRGMGEVVPAGEGVAEDRRVEFEIVRSLRPDETAPVLTPVPLPWNGEEAR